MREFFFRQVLKKDTNRGYPHRTVFQDTVLGKARWPSVDRNIHAHSYRTHQPGRHHQHCPDF
jgi:hypothetical protein